MSDIPIDDEDVGLDCTLGGGCLVVLRDGDDGDDFPTLRGYALVPLERYDELADRAWQAAEALPEEVAVEGPDPSEPTQEVVVRDGYLYTECEWPVEARRSDETRIQRLDRARQFVYPYRLDRARQFVYPYRLDRARQFVYPYPPGRLAHVEVKPSEVSQAADTVPRAAAAWDELDELGRKAALALAYGAGSETFRRIMSSNRTAVEVIESGLEKGTLEGGRHMYEPGPPGSAGVLLVGPCRFGHTIPWESAQWVSPQEALDRGATLTEGLIDAVLELEEEADEKG